MGDKQKRNPMKLSAYECNSAAPDGYYTLPGADLGLPEQSNSEAMEQLPGVAEAEPSLLEAFQREGFSPERNAPTMEEFMRGTGQLPPLERPDMIGPAIEGAQYLPRSEIEAELAGGSSKGARVQRGLAAVQGGHGLGAIGFLTAQMLGWNHEESVRSAEVTGAAGEMIGLHGRAHARSTTGKANGSTGTGPGFGMEPQTKK